MTLPIDPNYVAMYEEDVNNIQSKGSKYDPSMNNPEASAISKEKKQGIPLAFDGKEAQYRSFLRALSLAYCRKS